MKQKTYPQEFIGERIRKYAALEKLAENGENFMHAARSLIVMDALVNGQKSDYEALIVGQDDHEKLTFSTFVNLSDHFYPFKIKPDLRELLEIYIVLDDYSKTVQAQDFLRNLPEEQRHPKSHEQMLLSLFKYGMIPEVERLNLSQLSTLQGALKYREAITNFSRKKEGMPKTFECGDSEKLLVFAGVICSIAGIAGCLNLVGSLTLTEDVAKTLLFLMNNRTTPNMASRLCNLAN